MENLEILSQIESDYSYIENLKERLPIIEKVPLMTGREGFNDPKSFGIYKSTGGICLGVSKDSFTPVNLSLLLDSIVDSVTKSNLDINLNEIKYNEYKEGKKITFSVPLKDYEIQSPMKGDILQTKLVFTTGFDTQTKTSISYYTYRLWCKNGAKKWQSDYAISYKNTKNNAEKYLLFASEIIQTDLDANNYVDELNRLTKRSISQSELDDFYLSIFGINRKTYGESHKKTQKILDTVSECVTIEEQNTGMNAFSVLQGITRYTSHELAENEGDLIFGNAAKINAKAHQFLMALY